MAALTSVRVVAYDGDDTPAQLLGGPAGEIAADLAALPAGWTWRVVAWRNAPLIGNWATTPEVARLADAPALADLPKPPDAPR